MTSTESYFSDTFLDQFINGLIRFIFEILPYITIGLAILYMIYKIVKPFVQIS